MNMDVGSILVPSSVRCEPQCTSKKNALELLSRMLAEAGNVTSGQVLDGLAARERLGSTGLGASVAMPHVPVSFDSPDGLPVDLLFGLLLPADATAAELTELRELVKKLRDPDLQLKLRAADDPDEIYDLLTDNLTILRPTPIHRTSGG